MSNPEELPAFSGPIDSQEEALWQAYQAILRRRNDPRARSPAADAPPRSPDPRPAPPVRGNAARRIPPRSAAAQVAEPGPLVFQPIDSLDAGAGAGTSPPTTDAKRPNAGRGAVLGAAAVLAAGAALAVALWPRGAPIGGGAQDPIPGTIVAAPPNAAAAQRPSLPCFVDGRLVGHFTLDDCASRNGVASGSLQVDAAAAPPHPAPPAATAIAAQPPRPAAPSALPVQVRQPPAAEPPIPAPSHVVARGSAFEPLLAPQPRTRLVAPEAHDYADASPRPSPVFGARPFIPPARRPPPWAVVDQPKPAASPAPPAQFAATEARRATLPPGEGYDLTPGAQVPPRRASALAVREFYSALGEGDGARAASVVIPEKREAGPLSAGALTRFYGSLRAPLRITKIDPINDDTVFVRYEFVTPNGRVCQGSATVATTHRDGDTLVRGIRAFNGC